MTNDILAGQRALEEARRTKTVILDSSESRGFSPNSRIKPMDRSTKPGPWQCSVCDHEIPALWNVIDGRWSTYNDDCPRCEALRLGRELLAQSRALTLKRYGLDAGVRASMTLSSYRPDPNHPSQKKAQLAIARLIEQWKAGEWHRGIMLMSNDVGIGKTHLATAAGREFVMNYVPDKPGDPALAIWDMPSFIQAIKSSYDDGGTEEIQRSAREPALLIMDDIGAEYVSGRSNDWYETLMFDILNARWLNQRAIIATTNLTTEQLLNRIGSRAFSRLLSMTGKPLIMSGKDFRMRGVV